MRDNLNKEQQLVNVFVWHVFALTFCSLCAKLDVLETDNLSILGEAYGTR